jgi:hypothetical protein
MLKNVLMNNIKIFKKYQKWVKIALVLFDEFIALNALL